LLQKCSSPFVLKWKVKNEKWKDVVNRFATIYITFILNISHEVVLPKLSTFHFQFFTSFFILHSFCILPLLYCTKAFDKI